MPAVYLSSLLEGHLNSQASDPALPCAEPTLTCPGQAGTELGLGPCVLALPQEPGFVGFLSSAPHCAFPGSSISQSY